MWSHEYISWLTESFRTGVVYCFQFRKPYGIPFFKTYYPTQKLYNRTRFSVIIVISMVKGEIVGL